MDRNCALSSHSVVSATLRGFKFRPAAIATATSDSFSTRAADGDADLVNRLRLLSPETSPLKQDVCRGGGK
jgi:hypothetical protein